MKSKNYFLLTFMIFHWLVLNVEANEVNSQSTKVFECPDRTYICGTGKNISINSCFNTTALACDPCATQPSDCPELAGNPYKEKYGCNVYSRIDGCSVNWDKVPSYLKNKVTEAEVNWYSGQFKEACNEHDVGYSTIGMKKSDADDHFRYDLQQLCGYKPSLRGTLLKPNIICPIMVEIFVYAVTEYGKGAYDNNQEWARNNCSTEKYDVYASLNAPISPASKYNGCIKVKHGQPVVAIYMLIADDLSLQEADEFISKNCGFSEAK